MDKNTNKTCQLWDAKTFGQRLSLSRRQIFRLNSCGKIPAPVRVAGLVRWRLADIEKWIELGYPDRAQFEAVTKAE